MRSGLRKRNDPILEEFEAKDLGGDIARSGAAVVIQNRSAPFPTSIQLKPELVARLKEKAAKRGIGYQTMLKIIVHEHIDEY